MLLKITSAAIVLIDLRTVAQCDDMLGELAAAFPDIFVIVLSPFDSETSAQLYAGGAWEVVSEPARLLDLLNALESAHELHQELGNPAQQQSRVDAIIRAIRRRAMAASRRTRGGPPTEAPPGK